MKNLIIAANWKSNMTKDEAKKWLEEFSIKEFPQVIEVVLLAPFTLLDMVSSYVKVNSLPIQVGAQDVSPFDKGPYTGEVAAGQIKEFGSYVLIGHSERRSNFIENDEMVNKKIERAKSAGIKTIVCVSTMDQVNKLPDEELIIAYEPPGAISTSGPGAHAEDPNAVAEFVKKVKELKQSLVIYGGSVNPDDVKNYTNLEDVHGALVGAKSLDPQSFSDIIKNAV